MDFLRAQTEYRSRPALPARNELDLVDDCDVPAPRKGRHLHRAAQERGISETILCSSALKLAHEPRIAALHDEYFALLRTISQVGVAVRVRPGLRVGFYPEVDNLPLVQAGEDLERGAQGPRTHTSLRSSALCVAAVRRVNVHYELAWGRAARRQVFPACAGEVRGTEETLHARYDVGRDSGLQCCLTLRKTSPLAEHPHKVLVHFVCGPGGHVARDAGQLVIAVWEVTEDVAVAHGGSIHPKEWPDFILGDAEASQAVDNPLVVLRNPRVDISRETVRDIVYGEAE